MAGHVSLKDLAGFAIATAISHSVFTYVGVFDCFRFDYNSVNWGKKTAKIISNVIQGLSLSLVLALVRIVI